jgi:hypothetical protein
MVQTKFSSKKDALGAMKFFKKTNPKYSHSVKGRTLFSKRK